MASVGLMPNEEGGNQMGATGQFPHDDDRPSVRVSKERLAEFDRLMKEGGIKAVIAAMGGSIDRTDTAIRPAAGRFTP